MKKYIVSCLLLCISIFLNSMDLAPKKFDSIDLIDLFSDDLDKMGPAQPFWQSTQSCLVQTLAQLHILDHSNLTIKNRSIFDAECGRGETSYFLAQKGAHKVIGYSEDEKNMGIAQEKFKHPNLTYTPYFDMNRFDLIISCNPIANESILTQLKTLLNPQGEVFCLFKTQSNEKTIEEKTFDSTPQIKFIRWNSNFASRKEPTDELLKKLIVRANFEILTYEQKKGEVLILPHERQKMLASVNLFFKSLPIASLFDTNETISKKQDKFAKIFVKKFIELLKKDDHGNWFYPFDYTIVHIKKLND